MNPEALYTEDDIVELINMLQRQVSKDGSVTIKINGANIQTIIDDLNAGNLMRDEFEAKHAYINEHELAWIVIYYAWAKTDEGKAWIATGEVPWDDEDARIDREYAREIEPFIEIEPRLANKTYAKNRIAGFMNRNGRNGSAPRADVMRYALLPGDLCDIKLEHVQHACKKLGIKFDDPVWVMPPPTIKPKKADVLSVRQKLWDATDDVIRNLLKDGPLDAGQAMQTLLDAGMNGRQVRKSLKRIKATIVRQNTSGGSSKWQLDS